MTRVKTLEKALRSMGISNFDEWIAIAWDRPE
jgi:hypothetical protein